MGDRKDAELLENATSPARKILADLKNNYPYSDPNSFSPTANLKLLTRVASNIESHNNLKNERTPEIQSAPTDSAQVVNIPSVKELHNCFAPIIGRKDKSLSLLCTRFLSYFPLNVSPGDHEVFSLVGLAELLGTEKRRIYDIINILESLQMTMRIGKNKYIWFGCQQLHVTLGHLKGLGLKIGLDNEYNLRKGHKNDDPLTTKENNNWLDELEKEDVVARLEESSIKYEESSDIKEESQTENYVDVIGVEENTNGCDSLDDTLSGVDISDCTMGGRFKYILAKTPELKGGVCSSTMEKEFLDGRSLGILSQKFIMLLLVISKKEAMNMEFVAKILLDGWLDNRLFGIAGDNISYKKIPVASLKTKVRRLYDIANVLASFHLIHKIERNVIKSRKPVYKYIGPDVKPFPPDKCMISSALVTRHSLIGDTTFQSIENSTYLKFEKICWSVLPHPGVNVTRKLPVDDLNKLFCKRRKKVSRFRQDMLPDGAFKLCRTKSEEFPSPRCKRGLDSIFNVAEIELKRLKTQESTATKRSVFPRYKSEPAILPTAMKPDRLEYIARQQCELSDGIKDVRQVPYVENRIVKRILNKGQMGKSVELPLRSVRKVVVPNEEDNIRSTSTQKLLLRPKSLVPLKTYSAIPPQGGMVISSGNDHNYTAVESNCNGSSLVEVSNVENKKLSSADDRVYIKIGSSNNYICLPKGNYKCHVVEESIPIQIAVPKVLKLVPVCNISSAESAEKNNCK